MKLILLCLILATFTGCTVRGGWPRFMHVNEMFGSRPVAPAADRSDRPWLGKPEEVTANRAALIAVQAPQTKVFACEVEYSTNSTPGLGVAFGFMESSTDLKTWTRVQAFPYDGQTHYWTSSSPRFVRAGMGWQ